MTNHRTAAQRGKLGRHRIGLRALLVVLVWFLGVGAVLAPLAAKLTDVQKNTNSDFLPGKAESTKALKLQDTFLPKDQVPTVVFYERAGGLTSEDRARAADDLAQIRKTSWLRGEPSSLIPSADGKALQLYLPLDGRDAKVFIADVKAARTMLARPGRPAGLGVYVTGLGGLQADLFEVFNSIDTTLFLATGMVVILLLLVVYRSPVLWLAPVLSVAAAYLTAAGIIYLLAKHDILTVNGQSQGILTVLTFGAGTDYALLLIARYREELHRHERPWDAMRSALRGAAPAIIASGTTVILGLLCLLASELSSNRGLGPVTAIGITAAVVTMLTLLPAMVVPFGRRIFWPRVPHLDGQDPVHEGVWARIADVVRRRSLVMSAVTGVVLIVLALLSTTLHASGIPQSKSLTGNAESVVGQEHLARHFPAGSGSPVDVIAPAPQADAALQVLQATSGFAAAGVVNTEGTMGGNPKVVDGKVLIEAVLGVPSDSPAAFRAITSVRTHLDEVSKDVLVGGFTAIDLDIQDASQRDRLVIIPLVLLVILLVLAILLRSILAPLLLVATVVLSFLATLGVCAFVFPHVFHFAGADSAFPLFAFVFLVALGIDYNIFLMSRVRQEALVRGTLSGMLRGLTVTGGVITSAGIVLAATFTVLGVLPLVFLGELGFAVAFGVLLDTLIVRSLLVPALTMLIGDRIWWPGALAKAPRPRPTCGQPPGKVGDPP